MKRDAQHSAVLSLLIALIFWSISLWLHAGIDAGKVTLGSMAVGMAGGLCLAGITQTLQPARIYLLLGLFAVTLWFPVAGWPFESVQTLHPPLHSLVIWYHYYDLIHPIDYLLGIPITFAQYGHHGPDVLPDTDGEDKQDSNPP